MKDVKATGSQLRPDKRDPEAARRSYRDAHRGPVTGAVPGTYARRPPPVAPERSRPPVHPVHHDRPLRDVRPPGRAMDEDVLARRGGDKPWSRTAAVDRAIAAERGPRPEDVTAQPPPNPARGNWQARMDRANARGASRGGAVPGQQSGPARGSGGGDIDSMRSGWDPHLQAAKTQVEEALAGLRRFAAGVGDAPVHQSVRDAAEAITHQFERVPEQIDEVNGLTRQADAPLWDLAEGNRPNKQAWTQD